MWGEAEWENGRVVGESGGMGVSDLSRSLMVAEAAAAGRGKVLL